jgi:hypothetical protein
MAKERKKVKPKPIKEIIPKKRPEPVKKTSKKKETAKKKASIEPEPEVLKEVKLPFKVFKICDGATSEERKEVGEKIQRGELTPLYYGVDGNKHCHHFIVNKKN